MKKTVCSKLGLACTLIVLFSSPLSAQTFMFQNVPKDRTQLGLRFMRPTIDIPLDLSTFSGIYDFTYNIPIADGWNIEGSLPYTAVKFEGYDSDLGVGNFYAGIQHKKKIDARQSTVTSFGVFFPTADDDVVYFGVYTHYEELHKYVTDVVTVYQNIAFFNSSPGGGRIGLEIGPNIMIPTKDGGDTELLVHFGLSLGFQGSNLALVVELLGIAWVSEDFDNFADRFEHSITMGASYIGESVSPGVFYKIYFEDDSRDLIEAVFGVNLEVTLN